MDTVSAICHSILYYEALQKRKVLFDALVTGLQAFNLITALQAFPDLFQPLFVASPPCTPEEVWQLLRFEQKCEESEDRVRVASWLKRFVTDLSTSVSIIGRHVLPSLGPHHWYASELLNNTHK